jgi:hypothetical protein
LIDQESYLNLLSQYPRHYLEEITMGIDRRVVRPVQAGEDVFDFTPGQKNNKEEIKVYVFKDLKTKNMSASAKGNVAKPGKACPFRGG